jgi:hypothetical protein
MAEGISYFALAVPVVIILGGQYHHHFLFKVAAQKEV